MSSLLELLANIGLQVLARWMAQQNLQDENVKKFYAFVETLGTKNQVAARLHKSYQEQLVKLGVTHSDT